MSELNIPEHWAEVEWGKLIDIQGGGQPPKNEFSTIQKKDYVRLLQIRDFASDNNAVYIPKGRAPKNCVEDDILIGRYGASIGRICTGKAGAYNVALVKVIYPKNIILKTYLLNFLKSFSFQQFITTIGGRAAQAGFNKDDLDKVLLPLPPQGEQERIVQKIEASFQKIDETEKALNEVEVLLTKYRESLLAKAFRGELIPQDSKDEPASKLLEKIRAERAKNSNGKRLPEFAPITDDEKVFDVPESWRWVRLGEICDFQNGNSFKSSDWSKSGVPIIRIQNLNKNGGGDFNHYNKKIMPEWIVEKGDLLFAWSGSKGSSFGANLWQGESGVLNQHIFNVRFNKDYVDKLFLYYTLLRFQKRIEDDAHGFKETFVHVKRSDIINVAVALPPIEEQIRVSKRVLHFYTELDSQIRSLSRKKKILSSLRESIFSKSFEGSLVPRIETEGTGQELIAKILECKKDPIEKLEIKVSKKITKKKAQK